MVENDAPLDHGLRDLRSRLRAVAGNSAVNLSSLSKLEVEIVGEALQGIAERGRTILVTFDKDVYTLDLERMEAGDSKVYLLCDEEGNLLDINPLLPFVSPDRRTEYETLRSNYLCSQ